MSYNLSNFTVLSFKKCEDNSKKEELCKKCDMLKNRFVLLKECGHFFCRDCVDELYDLYNLYNDKEEMFICPNQDCCLKIYDIIYM